MSDPAVEAVMTEDPAMRRLYSAGVEALEHVESILAGSYKLTLVARNTDHPDSSRDVLISNDREEELVDAIRRLHRRRAVIAQ